MLRVPVLCLVLVSCFIGLAPIAAGQTPGADETPDGLTPSDWSSIREAYEAGRHAARPVDDGYQVHNPGQAWRTHFDGTGFITEPDGGGWSWGLELQRYGFAGQERAVVRPESVSATGQSVAYGWDDTLREWYVNDSRGLEHGYTVHRRPSHQARADERGEQQAPLTFILAVRGELLPEVAADGRNMRFLDTDGAAVLTYSGLTVFDADGRSLPARFEHAGDGLRLIIDESEARYPLTIDPIAQQAYLKASNTSGGDFFGGGVSVSGDTVVVGAGGEANNSGAVYVFVRTGVNWSQQAYLKASNADAGDFFGASVALSGDTVVIGAPFEASNTTGVNGNQSDNGAGAAGATYVFVRSGVTWSQQAYLKASNTDASDRFGWSVAVSGDTVIVGAEREDSNASGVNGNQSDNNLVDAGAAYVFVRSGVNWSQQAYLKSSSTDVGDGFGIAVGVSGDTVIVGARREDSNATGVNGNPSDNSASDSGAAYVFVRSGVTWSQQAYLKASNTDAGDNFGYSVAVSGDTVVVGALGEDSKATGVNGNQSDNSAGGAGAAYVFVRSGVNWSQQAYLKASNADASDFFGASVAVSGDTVVVGAWTEDSNASGVNGNQSDNSLVDAGAAYAFVRNGVSWSQQAYLKASNTDSGDFFGVPVAVSGDTVVVGAQREDSNGIGVNGNQGSNSAVDAGAAYVFKLPDPQWTDLGGGTPGIAGLPTFCGTGSLVGGTATQLTLTQAPPFAPALAWASFAPTPFPALSGTVHAFPFSKQILLFTDATGGLSGTLSWPVGLPPATGVWFQIIVEDLSSIFGLTLSNGLLATTP